MANKTHDCCTSFTSHTKLKLDLKMTTKITQDTKKWSTTHLFWI